MSELTPTPQFEEEIRAAAAVPLAREEFVNSLHARLVQQAASQRKFSRPSFLRPAWIAAFVIAVLVLSILLIGPQRVLAEVQSWLNYVPGIGFVNLAETRVLSSPVDTARSGVILRVEQVIAGPEHTEILISSPGISEADLPWPNEAVEKPDFAAFLLMPNGGRLEATRWELTFGAGRLDFPALPAGVSQVTLLLPRLPLVPANVLPENWQIPLVLVPGTGELVDDLFPQPYSLPNASITRRGITLRVLNVVQTASETAIQYLVEWNDPNWEFRLGLGYGRMPELRDDLGHIYWESPRSNGSSVSVVAVPNNPHATPASAVNSYTDTLVFPALSLSASQAKLWVDALAFHVPARGSFSLDLGANPRVGDSWPLDIQLDISGYAVHLTEARLREETVEYGDGRSEQRTFLEFELARLEEQDGFSLVGFDLANTELGIYGHSGKGVSGGVEQDKGRIDFPNMKIPTGRIELQVTGAMLLAQGPWEADWNIPGRESGKAASARLVPETTTHPDSEIKPVIEQVFLSDRLTAIEFNAEGLPEEATFVQTIPYDPATYDPAQPSLELYLEDNWGRRYEPGRNQAFIRPDGPDTDPDPRWQFFPPLEPLAQHLTLQVPGMEVLLPGVASFTIDIPHSLVFHEEEFDVRVIGGGGPERVDTQTRMVSDPWPVDISIDLAGYQLHFIKAQVEHDEHADPAYRLLITGEPPEPEKDGSHLYSLRFSEVELPDGKIIQIDPDLQKRGLLSYPHGGLFQVELGSNQFEMMIALDVTAADRIELLPGHYQVHLNGVTTWVSGPWEISWSLSDH